MNRTTVINRELMFSLTNKKLKLNNRKFFGGQVVKTLPSNVGHVRFDL